MSGERYDLILRGATVVNHDGASPRDIGIRGGRIAALGVVRGDAEELVDASGLHILPGVIDTQVHFREPGLEHKEDLESGSRAAALGGVTAVFEMPNTKPATLDAGDLADKVARGRHRMHTDYAFFIGAADANADKLHELEREPGCSGVKVFMGSSTGSLLVADDELLEAVLRRGSRRVAVHCEDEPRLLERKAQALEGQVATHPVWRDVESAVKATRRLLRLARRTGRRVHVLHVSTEEEAPLLAAHRDIATCEVTPQHLTLAAPDCYEAHGTWAQMNPPIRELRHREGLWRAVQAGLFDVLGSDHAPHRPDEKGRVYPKTPSGIAGVQTLLPLMLDHVAAGRLSLARLVDLTSAGAQRIFGIAGKGRLALGYDADLSVVDLGARRTITADWLASRAEGSPFIGKEVQGWPVGTFVRGRKVMWEGELTTPAVGEPVRFDATLGEEPA